MHNCVAAVLLLLLKANMKRAISTALVAWFDIYVFETR